MLDITHYLIVNPLIALGLAILVVLSFYNLLRRQTRVAMGMWLAILAVLFYVHLRAAEEYQIDEQSLVQPPGQSP